MEQMNITSARYIQEPCDDAPIAIKATINGVEMFVSMSSSNRHYAEIMRQVEAGELTIQEAGE